MGSLLPPEGEPLGLTVHSLPQAGAAGAAVQRTGRGRWTMLAVLLVCAAPVLASYFAYYVVQPKGSAGYGVLVAPQRTLPAALQATTLDGSAVPLASLKGQWLLLSAGPAACDAVCQDQLYLQRQLRESTGREKDRIDWVWLVTDDAPVPESLRTGLTRATVLRVPGDALGRWLEPAAGQRLQDHIYVVDPMGNWMMRFPAHMDRAGAAKARRDMDRLLRASASWDEEGRRPAEAPR